MRTLLERPLGDAICGVFSSPPRPRPPRSRPRTSPGRPRSPPRSGSGRGVPPRRFPGGRGRARAESLERSVGEGDDPDGRARLAKTAQTGANRERTPRTAMRRTATEGRHLLEADLRFPLRHPDPARALRSRREHNLAVLALTRRSSVASPYQRSMGSPERGEGPCNDDHPSREGAATHQPSPAHGGAAKSLFCG
jgi:hypothetical protein